MYRRDLFRFNRYFIFPAETFNCIGIPILSVYNKTFMYTYFIIALCRILKFFSFFILNIDNLRYNTWIFDSYHGEFGVWWWIVYMTSASGGFSAGSRSVGSPHDCARRRHRRKIPRLLRHSFFTAVATTHWHPPNLACKPDCKFFFLFFFYLFWHRLGY